MTIIGALPCLEGIVLFADRQETVTDYAKWDVGKVSMYELQGVFRVFTCGSGQTSTLETVREAVWEQLKNAYPDCAGLKVLILNTISKITKERILPRGEGAFIKQIWVIQYLINPIHPNPFPMTEIFRTYGLDVNEIYRPYFSGSPILLTRLLSDMYLENLIYGMDEAEALAAYFLWEAKEYDPNCGKYSDIYLIRKDGTARRQRYEDAKYWEEHFAILKESIRFLPLMSCSTRIMQQVINREDFLERLRATVKILSSEQVKWREKPGKTISALREKVAKSDRRIAMKHKKNKEIAGRKNEQ